MGDEIHSRVISRGIPLESPQIASLFSYLKCHRYQVHIVQVDPSQDEINPPSATLSIYHTFEEFNSVRHSPEVLASIQLVSDVVHYASLKPREEGWARMKAKSLEVKLGIIDSKRDERRVCEDLQRACSSLSTTLNGERFFNDEKTGKNDCCSEIAYFVMEQVSEEVKTFLAQLKQFDHRIIHYSIENMRQSPYMRDRAMPALSDEKIAGYLAREKSNIPNNCEPLKGIDIGGVKHLSYEQVKEWTHNFTNNVLDGYIEYGKLFKLNTQEFTGAILKTFQLLYPPRSYYKLHPARLHNELMALSIKGLTHPNLPKLIGYSCDNLLAVVYGDLRPKLHLFDAIVSDDFAWKDRMKAALQLADLIRFMHSKGIVVCTIAKENMLIDENDDVKLLSIGLHAHDDYEKAQVPADYFQRSYGCSAPEIALGMFTAKTDIYAYGILLLELVSKQTADIFMPHLYVDDAKKLQAGGRPSLVHESFQVADAIGSKLTSLALYCVHGNPASRPVISEVVECLQEQCKDLGNGLSKSLQEWQEGAVGEGSQTKRMKLVK